MPRFATYSALLDTRRALVQFLRNDPRTRSAKVLHPPQTWDTDTGGHAATVARIEGAVRIEIFVDIFSGLTTPRIWIGLVHRDPRVLEKVASVSARAGIRGKVLRRSSKDVTKVPPYYFVPALTPDEFDVLVLETFAEDSYLGVYSPSRWPPAGNQIEAIARDGVNLIGCLRRAALEANVLRTRKLVAWPQQDPLTEKLAVRHVTSALRASGFRVVSREHELCGYDLHATKTGKELHIEVKGASRDVAEFFLSRTEYERAVSDPLWRLAIVLEAKTKPRLLPYVGGQQLGKRFQLTPTQWHASLA